METERHENTQYRNFADDCRRLDPCDNTNNRQRIMQPARLFFLRMHCAP
jgi:hypothetical protein